MSTVNFYVLVARWFEAHEPVSFAFKISWSISCDSFSGNIHIQAKDAKTSPAIDPHCFEVKSDLSVLAKAVEYCDKIVEADVLKGEITRRQDTDSEEYKTDKDYEEVSKSLPRLAAKTFKLISFVLFSYHSKVRQTFL